MGWWTEKTYIKKNEKAIEEESGKKIEEDL